MDAVKEPLRLLDQTGLTFLNGGLRTEAALRQTLGLERRIVLGRDFELNGCSVLPVNQYLMDPKRRYHFQ